MKRDMDLVREILKAVEAIEEDDSVTHFQLEGLAPYVTDYHVARLKEAGFLRAEMMSGHRPRAVVLGLTWQGHEFLDAIKNDTVYRRVQKKVTSVGGHAPFEIVKDLAFVYMKDLLGFTGD